MISWIWLFLVFGAGVAKGFVLCAVLTMGQKADLANYLDEEGGKKD